MLYGWGNLYLRGLERTKALKENSELVKKIKRPSNTREKMPVPTVGRIVHYQKYGTPGGEHKSEPSPAVITKVLDAEKGDCQLFVMNPNGLYFNNTPYSETPKPGHWNWPPNHRQRIEQDKQDSLVTGND